MSKIFRKLSLLSILIILTSIKGQEYNWPWHWENGTIVTEVPERPPGQESVLGLTLPKMEVVRIGFVGLGMRGPDAVQRYTNIPGVQIVALCDYEKGRVEKANEILRNANFPDAALYYGENGYEELTKRDDIDLVYIATDWHHHFLVARSALENNKNVAVEVPSVMTLSEIWEIINLSEKKRKHCMILENCCYDEFELNTLNMAQNGVFGEVIRVQGAYLHTLVDFWPLYWKDPSDDKKLGWRLKFNKEHRGDAYPTHGLGPVAQVLNIHRGDRMKTLVAIDTNSFVGKELVEKYSGEKCDKFDAGDHTTTLVRTELGKNIEIQHNVMTPQPYNRLYQLTGTRGFANKYPNEGYALSTEQLKKVGVVDESAHFEGHDYIPNTYKKALEEKYKSPILKKYEETAHIVGGHGGMDFTMDSRLIYCLQNGLPLDMDVYDLAEWSSFAELGALSMQHNSAAVAIPDFTRGNWNRIKGYRHAYASPADEAIAARKAQEFTMNLKMQTIMKMKHNLRQP